MGNIAARAAELYDSGYNCAQALFAAFSDKHGLDGALAKKLTAGMGSGMRIGEICGAAAGAALLIGLCEGSGDPDDKEAAKRCSEKTITFMKTFRDRFGSLRCQELLPLKPELIETMDPAERKRLFREKCTGLVRGTAEILEDMGY